MARTKPIKRCKTIKPEEKVATDAPHAAAEKLLDFVLAQVRKDTLSLINAMTPEQVTEIFNSRETEAVIGEVTNVLSYWMPTKEQPRVISTPATDPILAAERDFLNGTNKVVVDLLAGYNTIPYATIAGWFYLIANKYSAIHAGMYPNLCRSPEKK